MIHVSNDLGVTKRTAQIGPFVESVNPFSAALVGRAPFSDWPEAEIALGSSADAFATWRMSDPVLRATILANCANEITKHREELAGIMVEEIGKPITLALAEIDRTAITFRLAAGLIEGTRLEKLSLDYDPRGAQYTCQVARVPRGPVLGIVPYNWPFNLAAHKIAPALAAASTILVKPSPLAPLSTFALVSLLNECGLPQGVLTAVLCSNEHTERIAMNPHIKMVSFTGSEHVGWHLKSLLPEKQVALEMGGDAHCLVFPDSDLQHAASRIALGAFGYAGQVCISAQHALVHREVYDAFKLRLIEATEATPTGDPRSATTVCGPMINSDAADRVMAWIAEAESNGATVLAGGNRIGNVIEPTLIENAPSNCALMTEEVFGPVLTVTRIESEEEALARVHASRFGMHCSVFTSDDSRIQRAFKLLDVGGVIANDFPSLRFDSMPYGGNRRSGFGREGVEYAYDEMTTTRVLLSRPKQCPTERKL